MKKLVCVLMALLCAATFAWAEEGTKTSTSGNWRYSVQADGTAKIVGYMGNAETLTIPESLNGKKVTTLGDNAFIWCMSLSEITIPDSVTSVGANPFFGCENLTTIRVSPEHPTLEMMDGVLFCKADKRLICYPCAFSMNRYAIPQGTAVIGDGAFGECYALTSISIPDSVSIIEGSAFNYCDSLTDIIIPNSVTTIGDGAFWYCFQLANITIPDSVTTIGDQAFYGCTSLTSISIPDSVATIGENPFSYCEQLTEIHVSPDHPTLAVIDGVLFSKPDQRLVCYPQALTRSSYELPQGVRTIGRMAFSYCDALTSIIVSESVTTMACEAFFCCDSLSSITIRDGVTAIEDETFCNCKALTSVAIPASVISIGKYAFMSCSPEIVFTVPLDSYAAAYCEEQGLSYACLDSSERLLN